MTIYEETAAAFAALDFTEDNDRLAAVEAKLSDTVTAIARAEERWKGLLKEISEARGPDGDAVADAMLEHGDAALAAKAAPNVQEMREECDSLRAGLLQLQRRAEDLRAERDGIRIKASGKAARAAEPLINSIMEDQRQATSRMVEAWAAVHALQFATRGFSNEESLLREAVDGMMGSGRLVPDQRSVPIPDIVSQTIEALEGHGPALRVGKVSSVSMR